MTRQKNYRLRLESEAWISHYLQQLKTQNTDKQIKTIIKKLELTLREYISLNHNKGDN